MPYNIKLKIRPQVKMFDGKMFFDVYEGTKKECEQFVDRVRDRAGSQNLRHRIVKCPRGYDSVKQHPYTVYSRRDV